jgi:basic membrane lipoprotein Med (substrate-binding protein (PBP1-ABC) superfamily)
MSEELSELQKAINLIAQQFQPSTGEKKRRVAIWLQNGNEGIYAFNTDHELRMMIANDKECGVEYEYDENGHLTIIELLGKDLQDVLDEEAERLNKEISEITSEKGE